MRVNMWGNEGTAEGDGLGTSGLHPQCSQNPHKHPSSRTEVLAAFHLAARGDSGWWVRQTARGAHGHGPGSSACGIRMALIRYCTPRLLNRCKSCGQVARIFCTYLEGAGCNSELTPYESRSLNRPGPCP